jgi:hypothetical protein
VSERNCPPGDSNPHAYEAADFKSAKILEILWNPNGMQVSLAGM